MINKIKKLLFSDDGSLKARSLLAAKWSAIGRVMARALQFISNLVLTRLLFPEAFGLMATASLMIIMVQLFSDFGVQTAIVQNPKGDRKDYLNTGFVISIARGFILFAASLALAYPLAQFYNEEMLWGMISLMSLSMLFSGFENPATALFVKKLKVHKKVQYEFGSELCGFITTVTLAFIFRSVWALVLGSLSRNFFRMILSYMVTDFRPRPVWNKEAGSEMLHFGKFIFINTMITWLALNLDRLVIGKLINMEILGIYNIGRNLALTTEMLFVQIFMNSYFPAVSSIAEDNERVRRIFRKTTSLVIFLGVTVLSLCAAFAGDIINILYDPRYAAAAFSFFWLSLRGIFRVISLIQSGTILALGRPKYTSVATGMGLLSVGILLPMGILESNLVAGLPGAPSDPALLPLYGACLAVFIPGLFMTVTESFLLVFKLGFKVKEVIYPYALAAVMSLCIFGVHNLLYKPLYTDPPLPGYDSYRAGLVLQ